MGIASSFGEGVIALDNYFSHSGLGGPVITYEFGWPANGVSGATGSGGLGSAFTEGLYYAVGAISIIDPAGSGIA